MITKAEFIAFMERLHSLEADAVGVDVAIRRLAPDFGGFSMYRVTTLVFDIMEAVMGDSEKWIDYFVYELDWGVKWHPGTIEVNGEEVKLATLSDLYDLLVSVTPRAFEARIAELTALLSDLADLQNGPPLLKYKKAWDELMPRVWEAVKEAP